MKKEIKELWANALESGEFKRGTGQLRKKISPGEYGHCCLGVLVELYCRANNQDFEELIQRAANDSLFLGLLPNTVTEWAGIGTKDRFIHSYDDNSLGVMNDSIREGDDSTYQCVLPKIKLL